jgi:hypothetical protein
MIHRERSLPWRLLDRSTLSPLVPLLWLLSINLAGLGVVHGVFKAGVWFGVIAACTLLGCFMYGAALIGRRS